MELRYSHGSRFLTVAVALLAAFALAITSAPAGAATGGEARVLEAEIAKKKRCKKGKKSATAAKKRCKKKDGNDDAPTPLVLTAPEVINQVVAKANQYCLQFPDCVGYGYYHTSAGLGDPTCSKTPYLWACYGWNEDDIDADPEVDRECRFVEIVQRSGFNGITSYQDLTYGDQGWYCFVP